MIKIDITVSKLSRALRAATVVVTSATVSFGPTSMKIETVGPSNVSSIDMELSAGVFEQIDSESAELSLDLAKVLRLVRKFDQDQLARIRYEPGSRCIELQIGSYEFDISTIHPDSVESGSKVMEVTPESKVEIEGGELKSAINTAQLISDSIIFGVDPSDGIFYINAHGDTDTMAAIFDENHESIDLIGSKRAHSVFSLEILSDIMKPVPKKSNVSLRLGEEYPAIMRYKFSSGNAEIKYGLAPRVSR